MFNYVRLNNCNVISFRANESAYVQCGEYSVYGELLRQIFEPLDKRTPYERPCV